MLNDTVTWVTTHWVEILAAASATLLAAERIAQLTPTDADNKAIAWIGRMLSFVALKK